jgi:transcription initiation factor TFIIIB Brf1 subunit/transcription initiation factor TFIIB
MKQMKVSDLKNVRIINIDKEIERLKKERGIINEESEELTQAFHVVEKFIKDNGYSHTVEDIMNYYGKYVKEDYYVSHSVRDVVANCKVAIEKLYKAGY